MWPLAKAKEVFDYKGGECHLQTAHMACVSLHTMYTSVTCVALGTQAHGCASFRWPACANLESHVRSSPCLSVSVKVVTEPPPPMPQVSAWKSGRGLGLYTFLSWSASLLSCFLSQLWMAFGMCCVTKWPHPVLQAATERMPCGDLSARFNAAMNNASGLQANAGEGHP